MGVFADGINTLWYLAEGDYGNAALSAVSMIPGMGDAAAALKLTTNAAGALGTVVMVTKRSEKIVDGAKVFEASTEVASSARYTLPPNARSMANFDDVTAHLDRYHGVKPQDASRRLHAIKPGSGGRGGADNLLFDWTGGVYDPVTKEELGNLIKDS